MSGAVWGPMIKKEDIVWENKKRGAGQIHSCKYKLIGRKGEYFGNQEMKRGAGAGSEEWQEFCGLVKPLQSLSDIQWGAQAA